MNQLRAMLQGKKTYLTAAVIGGLLLAQWKGWVKIPPEIYAALAAAGLAFLRAGVKTEIGNLGEAPSPNPQAPKYRAVGISSEDLERIEFLRHLDAAPVEVTDWEAQFIESFLTAERPLTAKQREAVDEMRSRYQV